MNNRKYTILGLLKQDLISGFSTQDICVLTGFFKGGKWSIFANIAHQFLRKIQSIKMIN